MIPIASILTIQPKDFVLSTNQSLACLSASESVRRDMPISVGPLHSCQTWEQGAYLRIAKYPSVEDDTTWDR
jgi:hypothetical protein